MVSSDRLNRYPADELNSEFDDKTLTMSISDELSVQDSNRNATVILRSQLFKSNEHEKHASL